MYRCAKKKQDILEIVVKHFENAKDTYFNTEVETFEESRLQARAYDTMMDLIRELEIYED